MSSRRGGRGGRTHGRGHRRPKGRSGAAARPEGVGDGAVYFLFVFLGVCIGVFAWLMGGEHAIPWIVGYVIAVLWLLNMAVVRAYRGGDMAPWQKSLARLPLRPAGFGARGGKPIEAAHGEPVVRSAMIATACASLAIAAAGLAVMASVLA
jgi:hypothetical protein